MASRAPKRRRTTISYKELSTDDEDSNSDSPSHSRRKNAGTPSRRSSRLTERQQTDPPRRQNGRQLRRVSYRDLSSDEEAEISPSDFVEVVDYENKPRAKARRSPRKKSKRSRRTVVLGAPLKRKTATTVSTGSFTPDAFSDGNIPAWASLPYHILLQVFVYASHPLHNENLDPTPSIPWLVQMARMCSAFAKPALTALYRIPPIFAVKKNRKALVQHLLSPPVDAFVDYKVMVRRLELNATKMTALTDLTSSAQDLTQLVSGLPALRDIDIFDPLDRPPYRARSKKMRRWHYPTELFEALKKSEIRLMSWHWNGNFLSSGFIWMKDIHTNNPFHGLRELTLTRFNCDLVKIQQNQAANSEPMILDGQATDEDLLASALTVLPNLKKLTFESSSIVNQRLLPLLPDTLTSLNFNNCGELTSDALQPFLVTHGRHLEELTLNHNQSLNLSFLVDLKQTCPLLEVLQMDLNYYSSLTLSNDAEPKYDELLHEGDIPSWPTSLRIVELEYLRGWSASAAKAFLNSIIDSAEELPYLRELTLSAMVDIDWRERAAFRKEWTSRFQEVFLKTSRPPSPHLASLGAFKEWKKVQVVIDAKNDSFISDDYSKHDEDELRNAGSETTLSDQKPSNPTTDNEKWGSTRLRTRTKLSTPNSSASDDENETEANDDNNEKPFFIQGQCSKVIVRIDNFRPREEVFDEDDFLDEEASGDEEWNGDDVEADEYAW